MAHKIVLGEQVDYDPKLADLFWETGTLVFNEVFKGDLALWRQLCRELWHSEGNLFGRSHVYVAWEEGQIIGLLDYLPGGAIVSSAEATLAQIQPLVPEDLVGHLHQAFEALGWLFPPVPHDALAVLHLAVAQPSRGRGVGADLLRTSHLVARQLGLQSIHLDVDGQKVAVDFYQRQGYEAVVESRYLAWPNVHPHLRMVKPLGS